MGRFLDELWGVLIDSGVWLVLGLLISGCVHAFIPAGFVQRHLAGKGAGATARASLLGVPLPLCSCSVIPVAASLRRAGAGKGPTAAFAISTPQTGEESIPLTWALLGPVFAITRPIVAVVTAFTAGLLIDRFAGEGSMSPAAAPEGGCCGGSSPEPARTPACCASSQPATLTVGESDKEPSWGDRIGTARRHGFGTLLLDLAPWLAVGLVMAAAVSATERPSR